MPRSQPPAPIAARALLDELVRLGLRHVVLAPGSRSAPLAYAAEALDREGRLTLHVRVDERSAAFLALGLAKTTRVPAAVVTTSGTAVANLHPAVLEADHGQVPLILLTADRPPELRGVGANQATEQVSLFGGAGGAGSAERCRLVVDVETPSAERLPEQVRTLRTTAARAVAAARGVLGGVPGPVHLNLPYRDPLLPEPGLAPLPEDCEGSPDGAPFVRLPEDETPVPTVPGGGSGTLPTGEGTLVVVGELPTAEHRRAALAWAARHALPVLAEPGAPPEPEDAHVLLPHGTLALRCTAWLEQHRPERLVVVGRPTLGRAVPALVRESDEVHLVTDRAGWADPTHAPASIHPFAALTLPDDGPAAPTPWLQAWQELGERLARTVEDHLAEVAGHRAAGGVEVMRALEQALPGQARVFLGSSSVARDHHLGLARPRADVDVVTSRGLAGIDGCVSTAAGLALADPGRPTVAVVGDLTFIHDSGGLVTGPDEPTPDLTVVVVDDDGGSIFATLEYGQAGQEGPFDRVFATPTRTDVAALAAAHGVKAVRVDGPDGLAEALRERPGGVRVVVVPVDLASRRGQGEALTRAVSAL